MVQRHVVDSQPCHRSGGWHPGSRHFMYSLPRLDIKNSRLSAWFRFIQWYNHRLCAQGPLENSLQQTMRGNFNSNGMFRNFLQCLLEKDWADKVVGMVCS